MFTTDGKSNYDRVCADLLVLLRETGATMAAERLGGAASGDAASVPVFGTNCEIRTDGIYQNGQRLDVTGSILVARYLLQAGTARNRGEWLPYRDLKDGGQFATHIKAHIEDRIAESFSGKPDELRQRPERLNGTPFSGDIQADVAVVVRPLPMVPVLCLFQDRDEEFPASFRLLFDASAQSYLDLESLAAALQYIYQKVIGES